MELREVLNKNIIKIGLNAKDKEDVLYKMAELLRQENYIKDVDLFVKDVYLREAEGCTGIGNGIAIPHGKSASVKQVGIAIATLASPIEWETLDGNPVDTVFLFCVSDDSNFARNHMILLSRVAAKLADDDLLLEIRRAKSNLEIINLLCQ